MNKTVICTFFFTIIMNTFSFSQSGRISDFGIKIGVYETGKNNAITDVAGVKVGQTTLIEGDNIRTGVTAILPYEGNIFQNKIPAAIYIANGFGKLAGYSQVEELGEIETPIILTNTLSVPTAADALIDFTLSFKENNNVRSVNPVVGETNDGQLNDIRGRHVTKQHVLDAIKNAKQGVVEEGCVGAGTGTICFGFKGGIGTASRKISDADGGYTVGVLVQTNYGGDLTIAGVPIGRELQKKETENSGDGSCMIVVATDAPITSRNLKRLARRAMFGLAKTGGNCSNGSGEYVIAFSTNEEMRISYLRGTKFYVENKELRNDRMTPLFEAVIEATEEAILNSIFQAKTTNGQNGYSVPSLPIRETLEILKSYTVIK
ncbi:MAG TPA: P1 family peptidase [Ignavibacteriaceae bacterium]|nr:P1 family peptidase [Ignavibacteriaceae bacterium]